MSKFSSSNGKYKDAQNMNRLYSLHLDADITVKYFKKIGIEGTLKSRIQQELHNVHKCTLVLDHSSMKPAP